MKGEVVNVGIVCILRNALIKMRRQRFVISRIVQNKEK